MNLEDKNIDELFHTAANQSKAPEYHSSYWSEMEALLNEHQKHRKGLLLWASFGGILMIGLVSTLLFSITPDTRYSQANIDLEQDISDETTYSSEIALTEASKNIQPNTAKGEPTSNIIINQKGENQLEIAGNKLPTNDSSKLKLIEYNEKKSAKVDQLPLIPANFVSSGKFFKELDKELISIKQNPSKISPLSASLELGGGVAQMYNNENSHPTLFNVALKFDYKLSNFIFSSGLGIILEQNPGITVSDRAQVYGFGVTNFEHRLNYKTLVDMAVPIQVAYQAGKNRFGVGAQFRYLATTSMRFESKENGETLEANNMSGITTGLNPLNIDAYGFYERSLSKNLNLGVRVTQQLTSRISSEKYFYNLDRTKVLNGQVYLKYTLFNY